MRFGFLVGRNKLKGLKYTSLFLNPLTIIILKAFIIARITKLTIINKIILSNFLNLSSLSRYYIR